MQQLTVEAVLGQTEIINLCPGCRAFWFEPFETIHLTPNSTLRLFQVIAEKSAGAATALPATTFCPTCNQRLILTHDRQRMTAFEYWRCDAGHGRFTSFVNFLREKDFIRPLSPQQIRELRRNVQMIHCSNCGAPIDLTKDSACSHCGAPLAIVDMDKMKAMAAEVMKAGAGASPPGPPSTPRQQPGEVTRLVTSKAASGDSGLSSSLIDLGLQSVAFLLRELL